ncbi:histidine kinase [Lysobacteraceae bacterium NML75-0749]|nr:histidine kinase [Xanthomonadaceae bacterium NML03-0222]PJK02918.1 histidine kinase [Xanthomonadaceae bacterium NML75-0749]PJK03366.1 histidine kinase [Xanthomonadaceae bacterium NML91-0268]
MSDKNHDLRHVVSDAPRVLVVDGSRLVRKIIRDVLIKELPNVSVQQAESVADARRVLSTGIFDLVTTSLALPDGDGLAVAAAVRESAGQAYVPVIVVSAEAQARLEARTLSEDVTDYFDKSLGVGALATFIRGFVHPEPVAGARILYVEDSRVVAHATRKMLQLHGLEVAHVTSAEAAIEWLDARIAETGTPGCELLLTDLYLLGELTGKDVLAHVRQQLGLGKRQLPVLLMTGDENAENQSELLRAGANDLVLKPIEERLLLTKALFQLRLCALPATHAVMA